MSYFSSLPLSTGRNTVKQQIQNLREKNETVRAIHSARAQMREARKKYRVTKPRAKYGSKTKQSWIPVPQKIKPTHQLHPTGEKFQLVETVNNMLVGFIRPMFPKEAEKYNVSTDGDLFLEEIGAESPPRRVFIVEQIIVPNRTSSAICFSFTQSSDPVDVREILDKSSAEKSTLMH